VTAQLVRYLLVGVSNTAITLVTYALVVRAGVPAVAASVVAFGAGAVNGYRLNRAWTFRSARRGAGVGARYVAVLLAGAAINALAVAFAVDVAELPRLAAEFVALPPATAATFVLARSWVFGGREGGRRGRGPAVPRPR
jgi:putative flippase GtrA